MKINHLGIAVNSIEHSAQIYEQSLGWEKASKLILDPIQKVNVLFMEDDHGNKFELLEPASPDSPVKKMLEKRIGLYHFCYEVDNINQKIKDLSSKGFFLISGPVKAVAFDNHLIAFLINRDNLIIELVEL